MVSEDPTNVIFKIDDWLGSGNWYSQLHASKLYQTNLDSERNKLFVDYYDLKYAVIFSPDLDLDEIQTIGGTTSASLFFNDVRNERYKIYTSEVETFFKI